MTAQFLMHTSCPECGSSDANALYDDGHTYCFSCETMKTTTKTTMESNDDDTPGPRAAVDRSSRGKRSGDLRSPGHYVAFRGISEATCRRFRYTIDTNGTHIAPYMDKDGKVVAQKLRSEDKRFAVVGSAKKMRLFGQQLWSSGNNKRVIVTEGEIDAMSYAEATGCKWPVVSVPNGAASAHRTVAQELEWLEGFEQVVFMFDTDEPGCQAVAECAALLTPGKARIAELPLKDPNEMLQARRVKDLEACMWSAREYRPDGVISGSDLTVEELQKAPGLGYATPYPKLNARLRGLRKGELTLLTAGSGIGKSTLVRELAYHMHQQHGLMIGNVYLEEQHVKTAQGYVALHSDIPLGDLRVNPGQLSDAEWRRAVREVVQQRMLFYKHFGSLAADTLLSRLKYMAHAGCDFIILDHISIVISGMEASSEGERRDIDRLMTRLRQLVEQTGVGVLAVTHLKQPDGSPHEEGGRVTLSHLRGSGALKQLSDNVAAMERDQQDEELQDYSLLRLLKNREFGDVGPCDDLRYDRRTGRLEAGDRPQGAADEEEDFPF